ncbi:glutathione S-transferase 1-like isoform X1 [Thrips palmi]|uniref:Glutathione S-transferase 1-like isoform X1 n=1 Tax=Thrips palmi TaxID=161013 RepID=A0A6P8ZYV5_THRPL|nr:glutathione S-transferase 1-like isoform X1 [Thrips palmi]
MLFTRMKNILAPIFFENVREIPPEKVKGLQESLDLMEPIIHEGGWLAGSHPTIADCCCVASVSTVVAIFPEVRLPAKVAAWLKRCQSELPGYDEINTDNIKKLAEAVLATLGKK